MLLLEDIKIEFKSQGFIAKRLRISPNRDSSVLMLESQQKTSETKCPYCGGKVHIYDSYQTSIKDVPIWKDIPLTWFCTGNRYRCQECNKTFTPKTLDDLYDDRAYLEDRLGDLMAQRTKLQNKIHRATPEEKVSLRREKYKLTEEITGIRKDLKCNHAIEERSVYIQDMLDMITANEERATGRDVLQQTTYEENEITTKKKERNYER